MKFLKGDEVPKRKSRPKPSVMDRNDEFLKLKAYVLSGKMKPYEVTGVALDQDDARKMQLAHPWRVAAEALRKLIKDAGLESQYSVRKDQTDVPGMWFVRVTYEPPELQAGKQRK